VFITKVPPQDNCFLQYFAGLFPKRDLAGEIGLTDAPLRVIKGLSS
jgi:hypothetical protein